MIAAGFHALLANLGCGMCRQSDDRAFVAGIAQAAGRLVAFHDRHLHVHQDQVEGLSVGHRRQGLFASHAPIIGERHGKPGLAEDEADDAAIVGAVVSQKDAQAGADANRLPMLL